MMCAQELKATCTKIFFTSRGLLLILLSGFFISGASFFVKYMPNIHPAQHAICRCWVVGSLALPHLTLRQENILGPRPHRISVLIAAFMNASAMIFNFIALKYLPLGEAAVLCSSYPAFVTVAGRILLKEAFGLLQVIAVITTIVGMIFTTSLYTTIVETSKTYSTENLYGLAAGLATIFSVVGTVIMLRKLRHIHFSVLLFNSGLVGVIESIILTVYAGSFNLPADHLQQGLIILIGFLSYLGLICGTLSLRYEEAGPVSTVRASSEILFSFMWQVSVFGNIPVGMTILGAALVFFSILVVGFNQKFKNYLPERWKWLF